MLYLWFRDSNRKLYINVKAIGQVLFVVGWFVAYLYLSHQDYLIATGKQLINLK